MVHFGFFQEHHHQFHLCHHHHQTIPSPPLSPPSSKPLSPPLSMSRPPTLQSVSSSLSSDHQWWWILQKNSCSDAKIWSVAVNCLVLKKYPTCSLISLSQPIRSQQKHFMTLIGWEELEGEKYFIPLSVIPALRFERCFNVAPWSSQGPFCDLLPSFNVNVGCSWIKWKQTYSFRTRYRNMAKQRARVGLIKEKFKLSNGLQWCEERLCARQGPGRTNQR